MQLYNLLYIIPAPNTKEDVKKINKNIKEDIKNLKGDILSEENLGNKKLSYPIEKKEKGFYISIDFQLDPSQLNTLKDQLKSSKNVSRKMIVKKSKPKKKKEKKSQQKKIKKTKETKKDVKDEKTKSKEKENDDIKNINDKINDILNS